MPPYIIEPIWEQFSALLPKRNVDHPLGCHRARIPDRVVFEKLVQVLVFGCAYEKIAGEGCSATTLRRRRDEWIGAGVVDVLREMALEAYDRIIGLELSDVAVDCCITKAPCGGEKAGRSPVDRGKRGIKRSVAVDAKGIPLAVVSAPANRHDSPLLGRALDGVLESVGGLPDEASVHLDRGYDSNVTRRLLEDRGLLGVIWEKGKPAPLKAGSRWSSRGPIPGTTPTRSRCGAAGDGERSSAPGSPPPTWSSSCGGSPERPGPATAGKLGLLAEHGLLAQARST